MKYILLPDEVLFHKENLEALQAEYKKAGNAIGEAAGSNCDWHDNFAFDDAQRVFGVIGEKLQQVNEILTNSNILSQLCSEPIVAVGKKITISIDGGSEIVYSIGGYQTPVEGRVSYNAPLIRPLLGKEEGEILHYNMNGKDIEVEIIQVIDGLEL